MPSSSWPSSLDTLYRDFKTRPYYRRPYDEDDDYEGYGFFGGFEKKKEPEPFKNQVEITDADE